MPFEGLEGTREQETGKGTKKGKCYVLEKIEMKNAGQITFCIEKRGK